MVKLNKDGSLQLSTHEVGPKDFQVARFPDGSTCQTEPPNLTLAVPGGKKTSTARKPKPKGKAKAKAKSKAKAQAKSQSKAKPKTKAKAKAGIPSAVKV
jgi:hypothetical protein